MEYEERRESWGGAYVELVQKERDEFCRKILNQLLEKGYTKEQIIEAFKRTEALKSSDKPETL